MHRDGSLHIWLTQAAGADVASEETFENLVLQLHEIEVCPLLAG